MLQSVRAIASPASQDQGSKEGATEYCAVSCTTYHTPLRNSFVLVKRCAGSQPLQGQYMDQEAQTLGTYALS